MFLKGCSFRQPFHFQKTGRSPITSLVGYDSAEFIQIPGTTLQRINPPQNDYHLRSTQGTAEDLEVPVIVLSQLSRAVETRGGMKRPMLSDLWESGAIEQDADIVMFLLRPEYYKIDVWDDEDHTPNFGQCEINFTKFRGGEIGAWVVGWDLKYMRFYDIEEKDDFFDNLPPAPPNGSPEDAFEPVNYSQPDSNKVICHFKL